MSIFQRQKALYPNFRDNTIVDRLPSPQEQQKPVREHFHQQISPSQFPKRGEKSKMVVYGLLAVLVVILIYYLFFARGSRYKWSEDGLPLSTSKYRYFWTNKKNKVKSPNH